MNHGANHRRFIGTNDFFALEMNSSTFESTDSATSNCDYRRANQLYPMPIASHVCLLRAEWTGVYRRLCCVDASRISDNNNKRNRMSLSKFKGWSAATAITNVDSVLEWRANEKWTECCCLPIVLAHKLDLICIQCFHCHGQPHTNSQITLTNNRLPISTTNRHLFSFQAAWVTSIHVLNRMNYKRHYQWSQNKQLKPTNNPIKSIFDSTKFGRFEGNWFSSERKEGKTASPQL